MERQESGVGGNGGLLKIKPIETDSEFGSGCAYCLGLFLMHTERDLHTEEKLEAVGVNPASIWFNGASDHLYGLHASKKFPAQLSQRIEDFKAQCLSWGHGFHDVPPTKENKKWAIKEALEILMEIDSFLDVDVIKGGFE